MTERKQVYSKEPILRERPASLQLAAPISTEQQIISDQILHY